jgi:hypothetical protein
MKNVLLLVSRSQFTVLRGTTRSISSNATKFSYFSKIIPQNKNNRKWQSFCFLTNYTIPELIDVIVVETPLLAVVLIGVLPPLFDLIWK